MLHRLYIALLRILISFNYLVFTFVVFAELCVQKYRQEVVALNCINTGIVHGLYSEYSHHSFNIQTVFSINSCAIPCVVHVHSIVRSKIFAQECVGGSTVALLVI